MSLVTAPGQAQTPDSNLEELLQELSLDVTIFQTPDRPSEHGAQLGRGALSCSSSCCGDA